MCSKFSFDLENGLSSVILTIEATSSCGTGYCLLLLGYLKEQFAPFVIFLVSGIICAIAIHFLEQLELRMIGRLFQLIYGAIQR
jgi:hypothetical protein